jgi:hypothetical protein
MIKSIYNKYFQKSKSFLYPALGIKKSSPYKPLGTYISIEGLINPEDVRFVCTFDKDDSEDFKNFEIDMLVKNPLFIEKIDIGDNNAYVFDYEIYSNDWFNCILGRYSKLSSVLKKAIKAHYGPNSSEYEYIQSYLFPEEHYETYARLLDINEDTLRSIGELCNPLDLDKETLKISENFLAVLKK